MTAVQQASFQFAEVQVTQVSERVSALVQLPPGKWSADDFRCFVAEEIERLHGEQLPLAAQDAILDAFFARFGERAVVIARRAFEEHRGMWRQAPVTVRRFEPAQDEFFAVALLAELA